MLLHTCYESIPAISVDKLPPWTGEDATALTHGPVHVFARNPDLSAIGWINRCAKVIAIAGVNLVSCRDVYGSIDNGL